MGNKERLLKVTFLVTVMLLAPIAGAVGAAAGAGASSDSDYDSSDDDIESITENVDVWTHSTRALKADPADTNVSVDTPSTIFVNSTEDYPDGTLNRSSAGVYTANDTVTLRFGDDVDASKFADAELDLLVAHSENGTNGEHTGDLSRMNTENYEFADPELNRTIDEEDDTFTVEVELDQGAGYYTFLIGDEDFQVADDGTPFPPWDLTVIGAERIVAHEEPSSVDAPSSGDVGDDLTFNVTSTMFEPDVEHRVIVYHEETVTDSAMTINLTDDPFTGLEAENVTIEPDIGPVNGVHTRSDADENLSGVNDLDEVVTFVTRSDQAGDSVDPGDEELDASSATVVGDATEELTVETYDNWTDGDYQWVHVATDPETDDDLMQVDEGTLELEASSGGGGGGGGIGGGGGSPVDPVFDVTKAGLSASEIAVGDAVDVTAKIQEASGDRGGQFTAELIVDGEVVDTKDVTVFANESEDVTFTRTFDEVGEYDIAVNDATAGTLTVSEDGPGAGPGEPGDEPDFVVTNTGLDATQLQVGDDLGVTATVENTGGAAGTYTAELTVDGQVVDQRTVTLDAGESADVSFTHSFDEPGDYELAISGAPVGTVTVEEEAGLLPVPGFGAPAALAALLAAALIAARRQA